MIFPEFSRIVNDLMTPGQLLFSNKIITRKMVDWNGLFKWSMDYQDGTKPSQFKEMSKEDRKWLEDALKQYTFNDADRLQQICKDLADKSHSVEKLVSMLTEL